MMPSLLRKIKSRIDRRFGPLGYYTWSPADSGREFQHNFGDALFLEIASKILSAPIERCLPSHRGPKLLLGGSTIQLLRNGDRVWGAGIRDGSLPNHLQRLTIHAVRGHLTAEILRKRRIEVPEVYGDPAILLPDLFPEWKAPEKKWKLGIVPHFKDLDHIQSIELPENSKIISPTRHPQKVIREITSCERICSSSLHGIICSEAYGIPVNSFLGLSKDREPAFKFNDYYSASNRDWSPHKSIQDAINGEFSSQLDFNDQIKTLLASFPAPNR